MKATVWKKRLTLAAAALLLTALAAGCGGKSANEGQPGNASGKPAEQIEIRVATWDTAPEMQEILNTAKKQFEASHQNVTVKIEASQYDNYMTKLQTQLAAGSPPDLIQIGERDLNRYMNKEIVIDLHPYLQETTFLDELVPGLKDIITIDGKIPAIPAAPSAPAIYYNKKLFDEANIPYPEDGWTWEQLLDYAQQLTKTANGRTEQYGLMFPNGVDWVEPIVMSRGAGYVSPDGSKVKGYLDSPETVAAFQWYVDLYRKHNIAPTPAEISAMKGVDLFSTGRVAINFAGAWQLSTFMKNPELDFGLVGVPKFANGERANFLYASGYGVTKQSKYPQETWEFLQMLTFPDRDAAPMWLTWGTATTTTLAGTSKQNEDPNWKVFLNEVQYVKKSAFYLNGYWAAAADKFLKPAIERMILEDVDIQSLLSDVADKIETEIQQLSAQ